MFVRVSLLALLLVAFVAGAKVSAQPIGQWRFNDDTRPVKAVIIGGSVSAWPSGSYGDWIGGLCSKVEVVNRAEAKLGTAALRQRFEAEVVKNRRLKLADRVAAGEEVWLVFMAGLNSIGSPEATNAEVVKTFALAHKHGMKVMGLSPNPWGAESDRRWKSWEGIAYFEHTQKVVDLFMGRIGPEAALGRFAEGRTAFTPAEKADVAVDLWDSTLRHLDAPLRDSARLVKEAKRSAWLKARLKGLDEVAAEALRTKLLEQAAGLPRWFMREAYMGFDAIHPNSLGHREIARAMCKAAPASWGCNCNDIDRASWDKRTRSIVIAAP
jgi:hypothetical protein